MMFEIYLTLHNGGSERGYASNLQEATQKVLSFYPTALTVSFQEIPMTAMRQGRENLGCFARKQAMKGDK